MFRSQRLLGSIVAGIGGLVALFALFRLPYITKIDFTNISFVPPTTVPSIQLTTQSGIGGSPALLMGLLSITAIVVAVMQVLTRGTVDTPITRKVTSALILLGLLVLVTSFLSHIDSFPLHPAAYSFSQQTEIYTNGAKAVNGTSGDTPAYYYGSGFWFYMLGMVLVIVGSGIFVQSGPIFGQARKILHNKEQSSFWKAWSSMFGQHRNLGLIISGIGCLLALLAFLLLPYITRAQVFGRDVQLTTSTASQLTLAGNWLFLLGGLLTLILAVCMGWQMLRSGTAKDGRMLQITILLIVLSSLILAVSLIPYSSNSATLVSHTFIRNPANNSPSFTCASDTSTIGSDNPTALSTTTVVGCVEAALSIDYGPGFWLFVVGMILVFVGSFEQIRAFQTEKAITSS